jgi:hypothetical protein
MAFRGKEPIRSMIFINNRILEQVNTFNYLDCNASNEGEKDLNVNIKILLR